jgi:beta-glucosidase
VSSDEAALRPARSAPDRGIEAKVDSLVERMTLEEKLQQIQVLSDGQVNANDGADGDAAAEAGLGAVFSLVDPERINELQHIAVEKSRLHIPILFAYDTIHGYRTIFPVPLGAASSFDPDVASKDAEIGARESATVGLKQIYSPMVDVSHEARWGRIAEGAGEDPYLGSAMAAARVKGAQGGTTTRPRTRS